MRKILFVAILNSASKIERLFNSEKEAMEYQYKLEKGGIEIRSSWIGSVEDAIVYH